MCINWAVIGLVIGIVVFFTVSHMGGVIIGILIAFISLHEIDNEDVVEIDSGPCDPGE